MFGHTGRLPLARRMALGRLVARAGFGVGVLRRAFGGSAAFFLVAMFLLALGGSVGAFTRDLRVFNLVGRQVAPFRLAGEKAIVFVFVAPDCPISNRYAPEIERLSREHRVDVAFWLVYPDRFASPGALAKHYKEFGYSFPALHDVDHNLVRWSGVTVTPEVSVYDRAHRLVYRGRIDDRVVSFGAIRTEPIVRDLQDTLAALRSGNAIAPRMTQAVGCYVSG